VFVSALLRFGMFPDDKRRYYSPYIYSGINYVGQDGELRGCHNDVLNVSLLAIGQSCSFVMVIIKSYSMSFIHVSNL
jgi:hypothetical protein